MFNPVSSMRNPQVLIKAWMEHGLPGMAWINDVQETRMETNSREWREWRE
jgi:hypothetical protein